MRRIIREHVDGREAAPKPSREAYFGLIGIGSTDNHDVSENHDAYIAEAIRREHSR
jgi:hypothetical protein